MRRINRARFDNYQRVGWAQLRQQSQPQRGRLHPRRGGARTREVLKSVFLGGGQVGSKKDKEFVGEH